MEPQELIDRLVQACEEQDVLFVLWWLQLMREEGILELAIDGKRKSDLPNTEHVRTRLTVE